MTHSPISGRAVDAPPQAVNFSAKARPDGGAVLSLLTVNAPYVLTEHRFDLAPHLAHCLLAALLDELDGHPDPGPRPEVDALLTALDSNDPDMFSAAMDSYHAYLHHLLANGGRA
ncbi:hypothetical protein ACFXAW_40395 [Streptomyces sp. NPDC059445]|uniref:hypothetical protein n=1 Tax=Streptomyces sp. NPDC059445 TaxID=3346832 RepID=UPI003687C115